MDPNAQFAIPLRSFRLSEMKVENASAPMVDMSVTFGPDEAKLIHYSFVLTAEHLRMMEREFGKMAAALEAKQ
jgi:hypothetical protein